MNYFPSHGLHLQQAPLARESVMLGGRRPKLNGGGSFPMASPDTPALGASPGSLLPRQLWTAGWARPCLSAQIPPSFLAILPLFWQSTTALPALMKAPSSCAFLTFFRLSCPAPHLVVRTFPVDLLPPSRGTTSYSVPASRQEGVPFSREHQLLGGFFVFGPRTS